MIAPWITVDDLEDPTSPYANDAIASATWILWMLSARKYGGVRTTTESYCQIGLDEIGIEYPVRSPYPSRYGWQVYPDIRHGEIRNMIGGCCSTCGCPHLIRLRGGPILSVQSMTIGAREMDPDEIAIYDYSYISAGRRRCWLACDDIEVEYTYGAPPPVAGKNAAKVMADQYILAMTGDDACDLPQRVTQVSRQGMSWTLLDPQDFLDKGRTGIYQVDLFLRVANPHGAQLRARVFSPDIPRGKTKRTPASVGMFAMGGSFPVVTAGTTGVSPMVAAPYTVATGTSATPVTSSMSTMTMPPPSGQLTVYEGRPLRWVVPGGYNPDSPPLVTAQPSGEEVPPDALLWRTGNFTLDLTSDQVERLLPPGSVLVVASQAEDGSTSGQASYPVERRTL